MVDALAYIIYCYRTDFPVFEVKLYCPRCKDIPLLVSVRNNIFDDAAAGSTPLVAHLDFHTVVTQLRHLQKTTQTQAFQLTPTITVYLSSQTRQSLSITIAELYSLFMDR